MQYLKCFAFVFRPDPPPKDPPKKPDPPKKVAVDPLSDKSKDIFAKEQSVSPSFNKLSSVQSSRKMNVRNVYFFIILTYTQLRINYQAR